MVCANVAMKNISELVFDGDWSWRGSNETRVCLFGFNMEYGIAIRKGG